MKDITLALFFLGVLVLGTSAPFVSALGYLWVSLVRPQNMAFGFFRSVPVAMILALAAVLTYAVLDRRSPPKLTALHILMVLFAGWVTFTTFNALYPDFAWWKWDWAFKEIMFACFLPFVIRTRIHFEALLYVLTVGTVPLIVAAGLKALLTGGGGYERIQVAGSHNDMLTESSALAMFATMAIIMVVYLRQHTLIMPRNWIATVAVVGYIGVCLWAAVGGHARTGLVTLGVMAAGVWWFSRYKITLATLFVVACVIGLAILPEQWFVRMATILEPSDDASASGRLHVWIWTWNFAQTHPFGGGFVAFLANFGAIPGQTHARAFHSIYFEVLGEHGYPGLAIFLSIIAVSTKMSFGIYRRNKNNAELRWLSDLALVVFLCIVIFSAGGAFIGVAFQPFLYLFAALVIAMRSCEIRSQDARLRIGIQTEETRKLRSLTSPVRHRAAALVARRQDTV